MSRADPLPIPDGVREQRPFSAEPPEPNDLTALLAARQAAKATMWGLPCWLAVRPAHQGQGLARPLLAAVLGRVAQDHSRCYVLTSSRRTAAIRLYLGFGFRPDLEGPEGRAAWRHALAVDPTLPAFEPPVTR